MNPFLIFSFLFGSMVTFFAMALAIESAIILFSFNYRVRANLRLIPFALILIEPFLKFFDWLNPLICNSCVQNLILEIFYPDFAAKEISLVNYLGLNTSFGVQMILLIHFFCIATFFIGRFFVQGFFHLKFLKQLELTPFFPSIKNTVLKEALSKTRIFHAKGIHSPMATKDILIPTNMEFLAEEEIYAHEFEHIKWKDSMTRLVLHCLNAFFCWIPMQWWINKIIHDQEMAADASIERYHLKKENLAASLVKLAKYHKYGWYTQLADHSSLMRVKSLMGIPPPTPKIWGLLGASAAALLFLTIC